MVWLDTLVRSVKADEIYSLCTFCDDCYWEYTRSFTVSAVYQQLAQRTKAYESYPLTLLVSARRTNTRLLHTPKTPSTGRNTSDRSLNSANAEYPRSTEHSRRLTSTSVTVGCWTSHGTCALQKCVRWCSVCSRSASVAARRRLQREWKVSVKHNWNPNQAIVGRR